MVIIRKEQMEAFSQYMVEGFVDRMMNVLRSGFPEQTRETGDEELRSLIRAGIARAKGYKVVTEKDVERYLKLMMTYGKEFDTSPEMTWAADILRQPGLRGPEKMNRLEEYARALSGDVK